MNYFKEDAKEIYGVELEVPMQKALAMEGITCFPDIDYALTELSGKINVVTLFHVLEHLP